jgi:hypothetical protein
MLIFSIVSLISLISEINSLNRNSERIPRSLLRGMRANDRSIQIPYGEDSLQLAAG